MSNYTLKKPVLSNIPVYIKKDSTKGHLANFKEVSWLENYKPYNKEIKNKGRKKLIEKTILSLILLCHSPYRGIKQFLKIISEYKISLGGINNIARLAGERAKIFNDSKDLSSIKEGALDEIFSKSIPAFVGVDLRSSYIFILEKSLGRSGDDWGLALLDKQEKQGLNLELAVMDQGRGIHKGVGEVYPDGEIQSDLFHTIREIFRVLKRLENKAYKKIKKVDKITDKYLKALLKKKGREYGKKYHLALKEMAESIDLYDDIRVLSQWFYESIAIYSKSYEEREWIYDYVIEEIAERNNNKREIKSLVKYLKNSKKKLLCFARLLERKLIEFKEESSYDLTIEELKTLYRQLTLNEEQCEYWMLEGRLLSKFGKDFKNIKKKVKDIIDNTFRASSIVENVNSLIRPYFFLRKSIGNSNFLALLQFYFNTKPIERCEKFPDRVGKSRLELLTGKKHPPWFQLLGY